MPVRGSRLAPVAGLLVALFLTGCPPEDETPDPPPFPEPEIEAPSDAPERESS